MIQWTLRVAVFLFLISCGYLYYMMSSTVDAKYFVSSDQFVEFKGTNLYNVTLGKFSAVDVERGTQLELMDPISKKSLSMLGVNFKDLANSYYRQEWKRYDGFYFVARDGYKRFIQMKYFLKYDAYLAYRRVDQKEFSIISKYQNKKVNLAPFYLVWKQSNNDEIKEQKSHIWPYQVASVRPVFFNDVYGPLFVPGLSIEGVQGAKLFAKHCISCHLLNGVGGKMGRDLSEPKVNTYRDKPWLNKWLLDPRSVRQGVSMPPTAYGLSEPERQEVVKKIITFLSEI